MENDLHVIPVLNKIDLPAAQPEKFAEELANLIGCEPEDCCGSPPRPASACPQLLDEVVRQFRRRSATPDAPARAMIFDSVYDSTAAWSPTSGSSTASSRTASGSG